MGGGLGQQDHVFPGAVDADAGEPALASLVSSAPWMTSSSTWPAQGTFGLALLDHVVQLNADEVLRIAHDARVLERLLTHSVQASRRPVGTG